MCDEYDGYFDSHKIHEIWARQNEKYSRKTCIYINPFIQTNINYILFVQNFFLHLKYKK